MKIHIDIGHPAHVHLFKNFARLMQEKGDIICFSVRDKENVLKLMAFEGFEFRILGRHYSSPVGKLWGLIRFNLKLLLISLEEKPDIFLSHGSLYTLLSSFLLRIPNISMEDTGNKEQVNLYRPFSRVIITSEGFRHDYGGKHIRYNGCHELAYLHPAYFTPDGRVTRELGLGPDEKYFIVRFISWKATHDISLSGLGLQEKKEIVKTLQKYGTVFISSESSLPEDLAPLRFPLPPERMHHALAFAHLYVGEGATMASESGILGTAAIYINPMEADSIDEQEKAGLVYHFRTFRGVKEKIIELLHDNNLKEKALIRGIQYTGTKTDLTAFLITFVKNRPFILNKNEL